MFKALIIDDEAPARAELRYILESLRPGVELSEARNGAEALAHLEATTLDVLFLDINLPALNGLSIASLLSKWRAPPLVVFATAYSEHAVRAFELAAFDYVVKPFSERRLEQTLTRIEAALAGRTQGASTPTVTASKLWLERENENRIPVESSDIAYFEAKDKRVYAHTVGEALLVRYTLKELEALLPSFARIHKSHLVNLDHVREIVPWFSGNYLVRLTGGATELTLSRRYAARLKDHAGWR